MGSMRQIIKDLRTAAPKRERTLARELLTELAKHYHDTERRQILTEAEKLPNNVLLWKNVYFLLKNLAENQDVCIAEGECLIEVQECVREFTSYARKRMEFLDRFSTMASDKNVERICFLISKSDFKAILKHADSLWREINEQFLENKFADYRMFENEAHSGNENESFDRFMKSVRTFTRLIDNLQYPQKNIQDLDVSTNLPNTSFHSRLNTKRRKLEALTIIASLIHENKTYPAPTSLIDIFELCEFTRCYLCWRLVPKDMHEDDVAVRDVNFKRRKLVRKIYCDAHRLKADGSPSGDYIRAYDLPSNKAKCSMEKSFLPESTRIKFMELSHLYRLVLASATERIRSDPDISNEQRRSIITRNNDALGSISDIPVDKIDFAGIIKLRFDLKEIWEICPNVFRYVKSRLEQDGMPKTGKGNIGRFSIKAVLEILDPLTEYERVHGAETRAKLHRIFERNFGLFFPQLAMAETFLTEFYAANHGNSHGGRRKNAGRKPKCRDWKTPSTTGGEAKRK